MAQQADMLMVMRAKDELTKPLARAQEQLGKTAKAGKDLNGTFRLMRGGAGQLGHQIQDVAVQAQMGTSAFVILGQQGSQVASLFGPKGALFGAFIAIAAAAAGPLITAITGSTKSIKELGEEAAAFGEITKEVIPALKGIEKAGVDEALKEIQKEMDSINDVSKRFQAEIDGINKGTIGVLFTESKRARVLEDLTNKIQVNDNAVATLTGRMRELTQVNDEQTLALRDTNENLQVQLDTLGQNAVGIAIYNANLDGVITAEEALNIELLNSIELKKSHNKSIQDGIKARQDEAKEIEKAQQKAQAKNAIDSARAGQAFTSMVQSMFGPEELIQVEMEKRLGIVDEALARGQINLITAENMRTVIEQDASKKRIKNAVDEEKLKNDQRKKAIAGVGDQLMALDASNKKVFMMQKAYKIVQATMDARTAFGNALAAPFPPPIPQMLAGAALAMGMANVATIKAQSFEGGGFTGLGARAGGLDGKGGRMAMVHPNESIIDHTKGGASGITVINNVDARGSGADVDQKIKSAMAQTSQQTIMTIQDLMRRRRFA